MIARVPFLAGPSFTAEPVGRAFDPRRDPAEIRSRPGWKN
jgi:hypothetical protein